MNRGKARRMGEHGADGEQTGRGVNMRFVALSGFILLVACGIVALSVTVPDKPAESTTTPAASTPVPPLANSSGIQNPRPYQYDPVTDRHWDPNHGHWHPGQPPSNVTSVSPSREGTSAPVTTGSPAGGTPAITDPTPWQYDPVTNKHWDPNHGHWHSGPAPAEGDR